MSSVLILSLIMVLVSGLIAYVGDLIGRRMGRKRLSLFGLRPKHTAIIISVVAGIIIAAVTLTATFIVSREVRELLFTPLGKIKSELAASRIALDKAHLETAAADTKMKKRTAELTIAENKLTDADNKLIQLNNQRKAVVAKLSEITAQLKKQNAKYDKARLLLARAEKELGDKRQGLLTAQNILVDITKKKSALQDKRLELEQQVIELGDQISLLSKLASGTFTPPAILAGQEILTGKFDSKKDNLQNEITAFLDAAADVVRRSSPQLPAGSEAVIYLDNRNNKAVRLTENEATQILTGKIEALKAKSVIVQLISANNVPVNGQAIVALNSPVLIYQDEVVYKDGEEIARIMIKKQKSAASAMEIIVDDLLGKSVPTALRKKHLAAVNHRYVNGKVDIDNTESFVSWEILLSASQRVSAMNGDMAVIARSKGETTRFSPLNITIDIVPANDIDATP
jgi:hypothetical protein